MPASFRGLKDLGSLPIGGSGSSPDTTHFVVVFILVPSIISGRIADFNRF